MRDYTRTLDTGVQANYSSFEVKLAALACCVVVIHGEVER